jgi:hypothetical protein
MLTHFFKKSKLLVTDKNAFIIAIVIISNVVEYTYPQNNTKSKLSIHTSFLNGGSYSRSFILNAKPRCVKLLDKFDVAQEIKDAVPGIIIVGRIFKGSHGTIDVDSDPVQCAYDWWATQGPIINSYPAVDYWEGYNEPGYLNPTQMAWYAQFEAERIRILANNGGKKACIGNFGTGSIDTPDVDGGASWGAFATAFDAAKAHGGILGLHEYGCPMNCAFSGDTATGEGWLCGRYRKLYKYYLIPNNKVIPLVITECGVDNVGWIAGCCSYPGWKLRFSWREYFNQLVWYDNVLKADDYVIGATIFSLEIYDWENFDIGVPELMLWLTNYVANGETPPDETTPPPTPTLLSPENNTTISSLPIVFTWTEVNDNATGGSNPCVYEIQIDDNSSFISPNISEPWLPITQYRLSFISNGTYYWRVRAKDSVGNASHWSEIRTLTVNAPIVPVVIQLENSGFENGLTGWTSHYLVPAIYVIDTSVAHTGTQSAKIHCELPTGAHFWQATPENSIIPGQTYKFWAWVKTEGVTKTTETVSSHCGALIRLLWADNYFTTIYREEYSESSITGTTNGWRKLETISLAPEGAQRVQVALLLSNATGTVWFDDVNANYEEPPVIIDTTPPPTPALLSPPNNHTLTSLPYTFDWSDVNDDATGGSNPCSYHIQMDNDVLFNSAEIDESGLTQSQYTLSSPPANNGTYYWRVCAKDSKGNTSAWSDVYKVIIDLGIPSLEKEIKAVPNFATKSTVNEVKLMYRVSTPGKISIRIYSLDGKLVKEITKNRNEGIYEELWDMRDNSGTELPSGIYLIHYSACGEKIKAVEKIVYIR